MAEASLPVACPGLSVQLESCVPAAALRYFSGDGEFAATLAAAGAALPATGAAYATRGLVLAWRSPTETLVLAHTPQPLANLKAALANVTGGCFVELTGALSVVRLAGGRIEDLLCRLGSSASLPREGESRRSRMADVAVLALCVQQDEVRLVLDRTYQPHLLGWIRATLPDLG